MRAAYPIEAVALEKRLVEGRLPIIQEPEPAPGHGSIASEHQAEGFIWRRLLLSDGRIIWTLIARA